MKTKCSSILLALLAVALLMACGGGKEKLYEMYHQQVASVGDLNDEMIVKYVGAYRGLRQSGIEFQSQLEQNPANGTEIFNNAETIIKENGFADYAEFVRVNAKIAWAWNLAQAQRGMEAQEDLQEWGQGQMDAGIQQLMAVLNDPDVPEETKVELRSTLAELRAGKEELRQTYEGNMEWAKWAMELTEPLTNDADIAVVMRHEQELMEVYTGLSQEQLEMIHENSMKQLGIE